MKYLCYAMVGICIVLVLLGILIPDRAMVIFFAIGMAYFFYCGKTWDKRKQMRKAQKPETIEEAMGKVQTKTTEKSRAKRSNVKNIEIRGEWISADVGKTGDLSCDIVCRSENGKYQFGKGNNYKPWRRTHQHQQNRKSYRKRTGLLYKQIHGKLNTIPKAAHTGCLL